MGDTLPDPPALSGRRLARLIAGCDDGIVPGRRLVRHRFGVTLVPQEPRRVVSVGYEEHDLILHFGVVPVLQRDYFGDQPAAVWPWARHLLGGARPQTFRAAEIPLWRVAAARPDLIMATNAGLDHDTYRRLSAIAPTVAQHPDHDDWETPRDVMLADIARVFGQEGRAERLTDDVRTRLIEVAEAHPEWRGRVATSVTIAEDGLWVDLGGHCRGSLLLELGFRLPDGLRGEPLGTRHAGVGADGVAAIDRDLLLWVNGEDDPAPIADLPGRRQLDAHRDGREVYLDKVMTGAYTTQSPLAVAYLLDRLVPEIEAAIDGDPSTLPRSAVLSGIAPT